MLKVAGGVGGGGNASGTVTQVNTGTGLTGGPITTSGTIRIANTTVASGSFGSANTVGTFTVNAQGQLTAAGNAAINIAVANVSGAVANTITITAGTGLTGGGNLSGNVTINLGDTAVSAGSYGNATLIPQITVDAQGRITSVTNVSVQSGGTGTVTQVNTGTGLEGGPITSSGTISLANTAVTAGTYGTASQVSQVTVDAQGRITSASNVAIAIANSAVSGLGTMSTQNANAVTITGGSIGNVTFTNANISGTTGSTATFATPSLPLVPEGYLTISINGTNKKIPYYGV
jgi:hypothetical protein